MPSGAIDPSMVLEQIEIQISTAKEEAFSRKDILEKVEKWVTACEEECWLEEYNRVINLCIHSSCLLCLVLLQFLTALFSTAFFQDENRYNAGRGAHLTLKRAEKARAMVNKIPGESALISFSMW